MSQRLALFGPNVPERQCKTRRKVTFVGAEIDRLEVQIEASASRANAELNKLVNKLDRVASSLSGINSKGLIGFANGIEKLGRSMQTVNSVKTSDFTRLVNNIQKLTQLNTATLNTASSAMNLFGKSLSSFGAASKSAGNIAVMANSLGKLGGKNIQTAISNLPQLSSVLKGLLTTLSQAPNVSKNVIQMTNAMANLSSSLKGVRGSSIGSSASENIRGVFSTFGNLPKHTTRVNKSLGNFSQMAGKFYARFFLLIRGLKELGKAIGTSMDYVETYNYFNVTMNKIGAEFGNMYAQFGYDSAEEYAESFTGRMIELTRKMTGYKVGDNGELTLTDSIGLALDPQAVMNYQASIAAVTNSVGLIGENSVNVSKALTMLSADMSSLKNVSLQTAMTNFQSGLIGQSRALYKYGIDITNATLQTYAYDLGLSKSVSEMTQAEKMQLRMIAILDQSKVAWGDQANTINSVANQYRIMKQQISNLARVIGNLLLPIVQKVLPVINGMIIALQRLFSVLGFKLWGGNWLKNTMDGISGGYADDSLGDLEDDANGAAGGLKNAGKAAEKLKTMVRGIDELNILSQDTGNDSGSGSGIGSGAGGIDLSDAIGAALADYESVWDEAFKNAQNKAQEYADAICDAFLRIWELAEPTREAIVRLWNEGLSKLGKFTFGTLKDFWQNFLKPVGSWMLGDDSGLPRFFNITNDLLNKINWSKLRTSLADFYRELDRFTKFVWTGLMDFYEDFLAPIAVWTMSKALPTLVDTVTSFSKKIKWDKLNKALDSLFKVLSKFAVGIGQGLINFIEAISPIVTSVLAGAINLIATALNGLATVLGMIPSSVIEGLGFALAGFFTVIYGGREISNIVIKLGLGLSQLKDKIIALFQALSSNPWTVIATAIAAAIGAIYSAVKQAKEEINELSINDVFTSIRENGVTSLESLGQVAEKSFNQVTDGIDRTKEKIQSITETKESIDSTVENIDTIRAAVDAGAYSIEEKIPEIIEQFQSLLNESKSIFDEEYNVIVGNVVGAWADILTAQGQSIPEVVSGLLSMTDAGKQAYAELELSLNGLIEQYQNGAISEQEFYEQSGPLFDKLKSFNSDGAIDDTTSAIQELGGALDLSQYIDGDSFDTTAFQGYMDTVLRTATDGKTNLATLGEESAQTISDYQQQLEALGVDMGGFDFAALYGASEAQVTQGKQAIDSAYQDYADQIQYCLLEQLPGVVEEATAGYENLSWWDKLFTTKEAYVYNAVNEWKSGILSPATESLQSGFETLGLDGEVWADEAAGKMINSLFDSAIEYTGAGSGYEIQIRDNWKEILGNALQGASEAVDAESYGKDTVDGYNSGIRNNKESSNQAIQEWMSNIETSIHDSAMNFGSPSKTAEGFGADTILGFNNGILNNTESTIEAINLWCTGIREAMSEALTVGFQEIVTQFFENFLVVSEQQLLLFDSSVINALTQMNQKMSTIFTGIATMVMQKWTLMLNQTRLSWTQINNLVSQNLDVLNTKLVSGMTVANMNWSAKWDQFVERVRNACTEVENAVSNLSDSVKNMCDSMMSAIRAVKDAATSMGSISVSGGSVRGFASGGYPETGELFMARENGINEMVGRIGNRSAVANNDQIVEAIRAAVVQGINADEQNALLREQNALLRAILDKDMDVSLDGRSLVDGIDKARKRMGVNFQPA